MPSIYPLTQAKSSLVHYSSPKLAPDIGENDHSRLPENDQALYQNHGTVPPFNVLLPEDCDREKSDGEKMIEKDKRLPDYAG